jgi:hypothetical protein
VPQAREDTIDSLLASARLWRGKGISQAASADEARHVPSGHEELDALLPQGCCSMSMGSVNCRS